MLPPGGQHLVLSFRSSIPFTIRLPRGREPRHVVRQLPQQGVLPQELVRAHGIREGKPTVVGPDVHDVGVDLSGAAVDTTNTTIGGGFRRIEAGDRSRNSGGARTSGEYRRETGLG